MGQTIINSFKELENQGANVVDSSADFVTTIRRIYEVYDELNTSWTGTKADECKAQIERLRGPLETIAEVVSTQGEAVRDEARAFEKYENS